MDKDGCIGNNGTIPWMGELSSDMKHFRELTTGGIVIMGRKTFESLPGPLKKRTNIIVSNKSDLLIDDCAVAHSIKAAISYAERVSVVESKDNIWIGGGAEIYKQTLGLADELHLTVIDLTFPGDTYFPEWKTDDWNQIEVKNFAPDAKNLYPYRFEVWKRKNK